jgi:hypothetical protein
LQVVIAVVLREHSKQPQHDKQAEWYAQQPQDHRHRRLRCFDGELTRYGTLGSRRLSNQSRPRADVWSKEGQAGVRALRGPGRRLLKSSRPCWKRNASRLELLHVGARIEPRFKIQGSLHHGAHEDKDADEGKHQDHPPRFGHWLTLKLSHEAAPFAASMRHVSPSFLKCKAPRSRRTKRGAEVDRQASGPPMPYR